MKLAGLILAAGASSRMGRPKALLELEGETFLDRLIGLLGAHCLSVLVVLGHQAEMVQAGLKRAAKAAFVLNPDHRRGQLSSLQCGLRALPPDADGVLFTLVDLPAVRPSTIERLARQARLLAAPWLVIPRHQGRRGHPVGCSPELIEELIELPVNAQARAVVHRHLERACYVEVDDPGILRDVDDPAAYQDLLQGSPSP
ncbi:MAG: nucleotidyltransferase family protein [Acidobacteria bacterium]|nr:nucleotidyltransferase family protein [Acidobacteriota bacterium]